MAPPGQTDILVWVHRVVQFGMGQPDTAKQVAGLVPETFEATGVRKLDQLCNGQILCAFAVSMEPKLAQGRMGLAVFARLAYFQRFCRRLGVPDTDLFSAPDIWPLPSKRPQKLVNCLLATAGALAARKKNRAPRLAGVPPASWADSDSESEDEGWQEDPKNSAGRRLEVLSEKSMAEKEKEMRTDEMTKLASAKPQWNKPALMPLAEDNSKDEEPETSSGAESVEVERRINPEDGFAYTLEELLENLEGYYTDAEIRDYWAKECKPMVPPKDVEGPKEKQDKPPESDEKQEETPATIGEKPADEGEKPSAGDSATRLSQESTVSNENFLYKPAQDAPDLDDFESDALPVFQGYLWKKSPSSFRFKAYDWRFVIIRDMHLFWWKSKEDAAKRESRQADGGPYCKGIINLICNPVEIELQKSNKSKFTLRPRGKWAKGTFTATSEKRIFVFDTKNSEYTTEQWLEALFIHIEHARRIQQQIAKQDSAAALGSKIGRVDGTLDGFLA